MPTQKQIQEVCERFGERNKIRITDAAQRLIYQVIDATVNDPHPSWDKDFTPPHGAAKYFTDNLELYLDEMSRIRIRGRFISIQERRETISFFDVLHWLTVRLDALCPFIK